VLVLKKHFQNYVQEEPWGRYVRLTQGAFTLYLREYHFVQKTASMPISNLNNLSRKNFCPNTCRRISWELFKTGNKEHYWAFWNLHLGHSRVGTTPIPNMFSEMCAKENSPGTQESLDKVHWLPARAKNKIIICIKKLFFFPFLSFSLFFSWRGGKCFIFHCAMNPWGPQINP